MKKKSLLIITFFTLISPLIHGYYFNVLDHHHYLPYLNKLLNPNLYPNDYYFSQPHFKYALFNYFIVWLKQVTGLGFDWIHLIIFLITLWFLYYAVFRLSFTFFKNYSISLLSMSLFLLPKWVGDYQTHRFYFTTRDLSAGLSLLSLSLIFNHRLWSAFCLLIISSLINPTIPIPVIVYWLFVVIKPLKLKLKSISPALIHFNTPWIEIIKKRGTYSFPHLWHWTAWGNLTLVSSLLVASWLGLKQKIFGKFFQPVVSFLVICLSLFLFHFIFSALLPVPQIIQLQLIRVINFVFVLGLISFSATAYYFVHHRLNLVRLAAWSSLIGIYFWSLHLTIWHFIAIWLLPLAFLIFKPKPQLKTRSNLISVIVVFIMIHAVVKLIFIKPKISLPQFLHYPNPLVDLTGQQEWQDIQLWAKKNTSVNSVFLTPPYWYGFRFLSERSIVGDRKDGGLVFYSQEYAFDWYERMDHRRGFKNFTTDQFLALHQLYPFNYLVVENSHQPLDFAQVYINSQFTIYKM